MSNKIVVNLEKGTYVAQESYLFRAKARWNPSVLFHGTTRIVIRCGAALTPVSELTDFLLHRHRQIMESSISGCFSH